LVFAVVRSWVFTVVVFVVRFHDVFFVVCLSWMVVDIVCAPVVVLIVLNGNDTFNVFILLAVAVVWMLVSVVVMVVSGGGYSFPSSFPSSLSSLCGYSSALLLVVLCWFCWGTGAPWVTAVGAGGTVGSAAS
jgi:hypothetical protein